MTGGDLFARWRVRVGYPLAIGVLWLARPTPESIAVGALIGAVGLFMRGLAAGYLRKHESLSVDGPYAHTRNPLYLGSAILAAGFAVASRSWTAAILVPAYFLVFYTAVMRREASELREQYGAAFDRYAARVPLFFPVWKKMTASATAIRTFSWQQYTRNREYQVAVGFVLVLAAFYLLMRWQAK